MNEFTETEIWEALRTVLDPELAIDIVSLGMVRGIVLTANDGAGQHVVVRMILTTVTCPLWPLFIEQIQIAVGAIDGVATVEVQYASSETWSPALADEAALRELQAVGLLPPAGSKLAPHNRTRLHSPASLTSKPNE
jgi:metal-sulfur cluster biosynthetic enzyme